MSNFIKAKGQKEIVNLDKVTYIYPAPDIRSDFGDNKIYHKIYFHFDSMNEEETLEVIWSFENKDEYDKVMSFLEGGMSLEIL